MSKKDADLVIIGAGVAAAVACQHFSSQGRSVLVVAPSVGASGQSSGAVDVADAWHDQIPGVDYNPLEAGPSWGTALPQIAKHNLFHPYSRVGADNLACMSDALALLKSVAADVQLQRRDNDSNAVLLTQAGTFKRSAMAQASQFFDFSTLQSGSVLGIARMSGIPNYDADAVVAMLKLLLGFCPELAVDTKAVPVKAYVDSPEWAQSVGEELRAFNLSHVFFPPIFSAANWELMLSAISARSGAVTKEMLAMSLSKPGLRLAKALEAGMLRTGATMLKGRVVGAGMGDRAIHNLRVQTAEGEREVDAKSVILASGKFLGGGIAYNGAARETALNLPLFLEQRPLFDTDISSITHADVTQAHPIFQMGVQSDGKLRPLDLHGGLFAKNLFAAGSILQGYDPYARGAGLGVAALTGFVASKYALEYSAGRFN